MALKTLRNYALAFAASALMTNALIGERGLTDLLRARRESRALARDLAAIRSENASLRTEAHRLRTDPLLIETIAREELGLARPDERIVIVHWHDPR